MPRKTVQNIPRKHRLGAKELTSLVRQKLPKATIQYHFDGLSKGLGWYIHNAGHIQFVGKNWVDVTTYIDRINHQQSSGLVSFFRKLWGANNEL